jgi:hypothetical protein
VKHQTARNQDQTENARSNSSLSVGFNLPGDLAYRTNEKKSQTHEYNHVSNWLIYQMLE